MTYSIEEISDRLEILDKFARYVHAVDDHCIEFLDEIFLPETVFDWSTSGGIRTTWAEAKKGDFITGKLFPYAFHVCTNIVIDFDEGHQSATARSKTIHPTGLKGNDEKDMMFQVQGVYVDKLVKTSDGWRFKERIWRDFWAVGPLPKVDGIPGMLKLASRSGPCAVDSVNI